MSSPGPYIDGKQRFTVQVRDGVEQLLLEAIALHPVLRRLPVQDRRNAARCGTRHLLLAIRSQSVNDVLDQIDNEAASELDTDPLPGGDGQVEAGLREHQEKVARHRRMTTGACIS